MAKLDNFAKTSVAPEPGQPGQLGKTHGTHGDGIRCKGITVSPSVDFTPVHEDITGVIWYNGIII